MNEKDIWKEYEDAKAALESARLATAEMNSRETAAINRVNNAQKAIKKHFDEQMKSAPRGSDFANELRRREQAV